MIYNEVNLYRSQHNFYLQNCLKFHHNSIPLHYITNVPIVPYFNKEELRVSYIF
jgi:hypothetical protein